jgi:hypothetical protein
VERQLARLRLIAGESHDAEGDIESVVSYAIAMERRREWDRAAELYKLVETKSTDPGVKRYASECLQRLVGSPQGA